MARSGASKGPGGRSPVARLKAAALAALASLVERLPGRGKKRGAEPAEGVTARLSPEDAAVSMLDFSGDEEAIVAASALRGEHVGFAGLARQTYAEVRSRPRLALGLALTALVLILAALAALFAFRAPPPIADAPLPELRLIDLAARLEPPYPAPEAPVFPLDRPRKASYGEAELQALMPDFAEVDTQEVEARVRAELDAIFESLE